MQGTERNKVDTYKRKAVVIVKCNRLYIQILLERYRDCQLGLHCDDFYCSKKLPHPHPKMPHLIR